MHIPSLSTTATQVIQSLQPGYGSTRPPILPFSQLPGRAGLGWAPGLASHSALGWEPSTVNLSLLEKAGKKSALIRLHRNN